MDVCLQCHLETTSTPLPNSVLKLGRGIFSFRPGERLEDYAAFFDYPAGTGHDDDFNIVHQGYRLRKSLCYAKSSMTCLTCHDPHGVPESPQTLYNAKCVTCHARPLSKSHSGDCVGCHMPKRRTDDIVHVIMTDHFIQRRPPRGLLTPKTEHATNPYQGPLAFYWPEPRQDLYLGLALSQGADIERGVQLLEKVIRQENPVASQIYFQLAAAYASVSQNQRAASTYAHGLELDPKDAEARFNLAVALISGGRTKEAAEALREAIRLKPQLADAYVALGAAEVKLGNRSDARAQYLTALEVDPVNVLALDDLGLMAAQAGRSAEALKYFQQVLRIKPDDAVAKKNLQK
jgi:Tfp pilus assembly protein PilF